MKKFVTVVLLVLFITTGVVVGIAYYFTTADLDKLQEMLIPAEPEVLAERNLLLTPPAENQQERIQMFTPIPGKIYYGEEPRVSGRIFSDRGMITIDGDQDYLAVVDEYGVFDFAHDFDAGVHSITVFSLRDDSDIADFKTSYFVIAGDEETVGERVLFGFIHSLKSEDASLTLTTDQGKEQVSVQGDTKIYKRDLKTNDLVLRGFSDIELTQEATVWGFRDGASFVARAIQIDYYPNSFYGEIEEVTSDGFKLRRRSATAAKANVFLYPETRYRQWDGDDDFFSTTRDALFPGDIVLVTAYTVPKTSKLDYHTLKVIKTPLEGLR